MFPAPPAAVFTSLKSTFTASRSILNNDAAVTGLFPQQCAERSGKLGISHLGVSVVSQRLQHLLLSRPRPIHGLGRKESIISHTLFRLSFQTNYTSMATYLHREEMKQKQTEECVAENL